jgi:undecaprenyl-diphosphatase
MGAENLKLFRAINEWSESWAPFWQFFSEAANHLWFRLIMGALVLLMVALGKGPRDTVLRALIALPIANGLTDLFKAVVPEPRPYQELSGVLMREGAALSHGTASAHAANMASVAIVFCLGLRWWGAPWVAVAILTGISRVYVGAHYPYQVVLGWGCGIFAGGLVALGWKWIENWYRSRAGRKAAPTTT